MMRICQGLFERLRVDVGALRLIGFPYLNGKGAGKELASWTCVADTVSDRKLALQTTGIRAHANECESFRARQIKLVI